MKKIKLVLSVFLTVAMLLSVGCSKTGGNTDAEKEKTTTDPASASDSIFTGTESTGTIIKFGLYPQSRVTDKATIEKLENQSKDWISYNYYSGTGTVDDGQMKPSDYMKYADVKLDNDKYRCVIFSHFRPTATGNTATEKNSNQDDNGYAKDEIYYFKYEPLEWKVLDASQGLVMCSTIIDSQAYNNFMIDGGGEDKYGDAEKTYFASNYEHSSIRKWLNEDFLNTAFSAAQQAKIKTTHLENKCRYDSKYYSADTDDKVFLLSYWEVLNQSYGFSTLYKSIDYARQLKSTDYAKCQGLLVSPSKDYQGNSNWWLRSPEYSSNATFVDLIGESYYYYGVNYTDCGVVPAICIER